jgi:hypothetical protein
MIVTAVSACWAWIACATHLVCWRRLSTGKAQFSSTWSLLSLGTAALTFTYATAYTWLVFGNPDRAYWSELLGYVALVGWPVVYWSELLGYVALVGWPVVWILPGWATLYAFRIQRRNIAGGQQ